MCLTRVKEKKVLKADIMVFKLMFIEGGLEITICETVFLNKHINKASKHILTDNNGNEYNSGYHCYTVNNSEIKKGWAFHKVLPYIIPKGTEIQCGLEDNLDVVITPVLINPRIPKKKQKGGKR